MAGTVVAVGVLVLPLSCWSNEDGCLDDRYGVDCSRSSSSGM
jgi:hypothetical protein